MAEARPVATDMEVEATASETVAMVAVAMAVMAMMAIISPSWQ